MLRKCDKLAFQGDIGLLVVGELPYGCSKVTHPLSGNDANSYGYHKEKGLVLAQGESRNHYHAFRDTDNVEMYELNASNDNKRIFIVVNNTAILQHEEHDPIEFKPNVYELFFQKEYTFTEEYRRVAD